MKKPNDFVKLKNKHLIMRFGLTGITQSISMLKVESYFQFYRNGVELCAKALDQDDVVIENFPTEMLATDALILTAETLHNQTETKPCWKKWIPWIVAPLLLLCIRDFLFFHGNRRCSERRIFWHVIGIIKTGNRIRQAACYF